MGQIFNKPERRPEAISTNPPMRYTPDGLHEQISKFIPREADAEKFANVKKFGKNNLSCNVDCPEGNHCYRSGDYGCISGETMPDREQCCQQHIDLRSKKAYLGFLTQMVESAFSNKFNLGKARPAYKKRVREILNTITDGKTVRRSSLFSEPDHLFGFHTLIMYPIYVVINTIPDNSKLDLIKLGSNLLKNF